MTSWVVTARGLSLSYNGRPPVLCDLDLRVASGEFFMIIGPNGSGKTSLLRLLAGLIAPEAGQVEILAKPLTSWPRRHLAQRLAVVPQQLPQDFPFTVAETVLMGRAPHLGLLDVEGESDRELARAAMHFTDVTRLADRRLDQLSEGERQRVVIARALCQEPEILMLDEPTSSLDPAHQIQIMDLLSRLRAERGVTVIMVSHDLNLAALYGDRLLLIDRGRTVLCGSPAEVLTAERLSVCYGCTILVDTHGLGGLPRVTPLPASYGGHVVPAEEPSGRRGS
ncbi:MAG: ABC transporter ATP-binding protein [Desulfobacteraceae bacterium]|nr:ABC transporter ATP-binding protein [Desulfobacteraceae bacterium]